MKKKKGGFPAAWVMIGLLSMGVGLASILGMATMVQAAPLSGTGFANFTLNTSVNGQDGWSATGNWDEEVVDDGTGNKVWRVSNAMTAGSFGDMPFAPRPGGIPDGVNDPVNSDPIYFAGEPSTGAAARKFWSEFSFQSATGAPQPGLRITISIDNGEGARQSFVALTDTGSGIDIETFDVDKNDGTFIGPIIIASGVSYTKWHTISMEAHFKKGTKNDKVKYFVNGKLEHVGTSWEEFYRNAQPAQHPNGVPVQTLIFRLSGTAVPGVSGGGYYIDDVFTSNSDVKKKKDDDDSGSDDDSS